MGYTVEFWRLTKDDNTQHRFTTDLAAQGTKIFVGNQPSSDHAVDTSFNIYCTFRETNTSNPVDQEAGLYYKKNGGSKVNITASSAEIQTVDGQPADASTIGNLLKLSDPATGTFQNGNYDDATGAVTTDMAQNFWTTLGFCLQVVSADVDVDRYR